MIRREQVAGRLALNAPLAVAVLTDFIRDAVATSATEGVVVGLSGGVDSALAAALAARALGPSRVHAFVLPYRTSNPESARDACLVAKQLGVDHRLIDISPMVDPYFALEIPGEGEEDRRRRGNKLARERMAILFDQAKKLGCLVLGTSNKTEILLGYSTVFGDNASSLNPLGDLYKQQVWRLAQHLALPRQVVAKQPSADLWPGQTDEEELGLTYEVADEVLYLLFDLGLRPAEVVERGYAEEAVRRIVRLEQANRYKRRLMLIARLSGSAINLDQEIPRD
ncbi:MAG TPA: NAD+ synthase [Thermoanaerobaculia bacterium]|jgi:NAD+ synthase|nr:NAD+ synthase [Thermoanaerobaculia bacterium]